MTRIEAVRADITAIPVDAIVNAANEHLQHGGGVAAAISHAGGPSIQAESEAWVREHGPLGPGDAAVTGGGDLPVRVVVHVVGPRYRDGQDNAGMLAAAVAAALGAAADAGARTVAVPAISAGIFGYPLHEATTVIVDAARRWVGEHPDTLDRIVLVGYSDEAAAAFRSALG